MTRILLLNDTSLGDAHFGCQLVGQTIREQLCRVGLDLALSMSKHVALDEIRKLRHLFDFVIVNGEGTIHHGNGRNLVEVAAEFPSALINCVYQDNPPWPALAEFKLVAARESLSAAAIEAQDVSCEVVPDMVFGSSMLTAFANEYRSRDHSAQPRLPLGETDNVVRPWNIQLGPLRIPRPGGLLQLNAKTVAIYLRKLTQYERLCVGRFHAACIAAKLGIPFASWDSNTWKTEAIMADMGASTLHFVTRGEARRAARTATTLPSIAAYVDAAPGRIRALFDRIAQVAGPYASG